MPHMANLPWLQFIILSNLISFYVMYNSSTSITSNKNMSNKKTFLNKKW